MLSVWSSPKFCCFSKQLTKLQLAADKNDDQRGNVLES